MNKNEISLQGKKAIVTGATRGIGRSIADLLSDCGCQVIVTGRNSASGKLQTGQEYLPLDLADAASLGRFLGSVQALGQVDILVNNAGINVISPIQDIQVEDWDRILQVNLTGAMRVMKTVSGLMIERKQGGKILNISSIFGLVSREKRNAYSASKAGMIGLTKASALDLAPHGILVNALCPGFTVTELTAAMLSSSDKEQLCQRIPLGRFASVEEIARAAVFLCSDMNSYMTGQTLVVDGGFLTQ